LPAADAVALAAAGLVAGLSWGAGVGFGLVALVALAGAGSHRVRICPRVSDQVPRLAAAVWLAAGVLLPFVSARTVLFAALYGGGFVVLGRGCCAAVLRAARSRGRLADPTLVVGAGELAVRIADVAARRPEYGLRVRGVVDELPERVDVTRVIVCAVDESLVPALRAVRALGVDVCVVPRLPELGAAVPLSCVDDVWGIPLLPLRSGWVTPTGRFVKRVFDLLVASVLTVLVAPLVAVLGCAVVLRGGRPALFRQVRLTGAGRLAWVPKLRTLPWHPDADTRWAVPVAGVDRFSRWLRTTHLDELPQLYSVLRGEMSLVGPRPERPYFARRFADRVPGYADRLRMPAGLTGWAQVHGLHGDSSIRDRVRFDNQYVEYWSPWLDVVILARTLWPRRAPAHRTSSRRRGDRE
jgi:lipopolysaccharide/colanic/teichoic acid biosynthesis glycosyltransferase